MAALGALAARVGAFVWSEAALVLGAALALAALLGWLLAEMLVAMLQHVFDPPPDHLAIPWGFLAALGGAALVGCLVAAAARRAAGCAGCRSARSCARSDEARHRARPVDPDRRGRRRAARRLLRRGLREEGFEVDGGRDRRRAARARRASRRRTRSSSTSACPTPTGATSARRCARGASRRPCCS